MKKLFFRIFRKKIDEYRDFSIQEKNFSGICTSFSATDFVRPDLVCMCVGCNQPL